MSLTNTLAKNAAHRKATGLLEPLLDDDESTDDEETLEDQMEIEKQSPLQKLKTSAVYVILGAGLAICAAAMVISPQTLVFIAGGICCANVPYSAYKEHALSKIPTLRSLNNALREDANRLSHEVDTLSEEIDLLEPEADRAAAVEEELRDIAERQQFNVDRLVDLVKENGIIIDQMKDNLRRRIVQDVIHIVVSSDRDGDNSISRQEAKALSLQIQIQLETYGVEFDCEKFIKVIGMNPTLAKVISIVQKLLPSENEEEEDKNEDGLDDDDYDMFYIVEDDHGSISVTSDDVIGAALAFGGDSPNHPGRTRKSLLVDSKTHHSQRRRESRTIAGSLMAGKGDERVSHRRSSLARRK
ncbi:hypothetical protein HJC23_000813 [Cyclotella cryptica]|uniref:Calmodulin n=1 Tax=Cyclotella cryptica TaxID=29204 RepID=A0ABD3Q581_9STRA